LYKEFSGIEITVHGLVQGVGFRYFIKNQADFLGIIGYVKNNIDGTVLINAFGDKEKLSQLVDIAKVGPSRSQVTNSKIRSIEYSDKFNCFSIK
jgi:acylphosphatase